MTRKGNHKSNAILLIQKIHSIQEVVSIYGFTKKFNCLVGKDEHVFIAKIIINFSDFVVL